MVPDARIRHVNDAPIRAERPFVLYWMIAARRVPYNYALERAADHAESLGKPLLVLEALRVGYPWASDRLHRFVLEGMADNAERLRGIEGALHYPYVERVAGEGRGLLRTLADSAAVVVTDDYPAFFLPAMIRAAGAQLDVRLEAIDGNGMIPMRLARKAFARAVDFRRHLHRHLPPQLDAMPREDPLTGRRFGSAPKVPAHVRKRWPSADRELGEPDVLIGRLPIDHGVRPVALRGGSTAGIARLHAFLDDGFERYATARNHPDEDASSGLSPWLHFGHLAVHQVFAELAAREKFTPRALKPSAAGRRAGYFGMSENAEAFLDELLTWRELGFNMCVERADYAEYASLPAWARETLEVHARDPRPQIYSFEELERAETADLVWNAAQRQLLVEGRIQNYLRMLWGKRILEWTPSPEVALQTLIALNDKYAVDGRDPNSYSGICWTLGRYDRPWGPERPIFGKVRFMSSGNTMKKLRMQKYLARFGEGA